MDTKRMLFAVEKERILSFPVRPEAKSFSEMVEGFDLGVYSALRTFKHDQFLHLDDHLARTRQSMRLLGWSFTLDEKRLRQALDAVCRAYPLPDARVRYDILSSPAVHLQTDSRMIISMMPMPPIPEALYTDGVQLDFTAALRRDRPLIKAARFARERDQAPHFETVYEYLLVDDEGYILEGSGSNFYAVRDGVLRTAATGVLEGVTRKVLLQLAGQLGIPVSLQPVHREGIGELSEAAISSSSRALIPAVRIAGQQVGNGRPGPICRRLLAAYRAYVETAVRPALPRS